MIFNAYKKKVQYSTENCLNKYYKGNRMLIEMQMKKRERKKWH